MFSEIYVGISRDVHAKFGGERYFLTVPFAPPQAGSQDSIFCFLSVIVLPRCCWCKASIYTLPCMAYCNQGKIRSKLHSAVELCARVCTSMTFAYYPFWIGREDGVNCSWQMKGSWRCCQQVWRCCQRVQFIFYVFGPEYINQDFMQHLYE